MSRLELGGHEGAIPNIALPDPNLSADLPIQSLVQVDGVPFEKEEWVVLGYTHYEVWCVGAAGGQGANAGDLNIRDLNSPTQERIPDDLWAKMKEQFVTQAPVPYYVKETGNMLPPSPGAPYGLPETIILTPAELFEYENPNHMMEIYNHHDPFVIEPNRPALGGGGGGGGLHVMSGELADLPDSVPITVGEAGLQSLPGQTNSPNPYDPYSVVDYSIWQQYGTMTDRDVEQFRNRYPPVGGRTLLLPGQSGSDGGYSSFGDISMASGGKGGGPAIIWVNGVRMFAAHGGEGGIGGRTASGGGAAGSTSANIPGRDGTWDGTIGTGGGGGRGGMASIAETKLTYGV